LNLNIRDILAGIYQLESPVCKWVIYETERGKDPLEKPGTKDRTWVGLDFK
jgi:hypothetical protein